MFKIALEEGLIDPHRTIQIGIRGAMGDLRQDDWAHDAGYRIIEIDEFNDIGVDSVIAEARRIIGDDGKPTYISWDLDVLDPAYAPAVADPETDGISINEAIKLIRGFRGINIIGADIVCFTPHLDTTRITALNASSILHELTFRNYKKTRSEADYRVTKDEYIRTMLALWISCLNSTIYITLVAVIQLAVIFCLAYTA